jgi:hypothetical protein
VGNEITARRIRDGPDLPGQNILVRAIRHGQKGNHYVQLGLPVQGAENDMSLCRLDP